MPTGSGSLWVTYHQFWLIGDAGLPAAHDMSSDASSLIDLYPDGAMIRTGIAYGLVAVTVDRLHEPPTALNVCRCVTCIWQPLQVVFACFWNVGSKTAGLNTTPSSASAFICSANRSAIGHGAPVISNGRVVPRPSETLVPSNSTAPG